MSEKTRKPQNQEMSAVKSIFSKIGKKNSGLLNVKSGMNFLDLLSTHFLICNEKIEGKGEDSGFELYTTQAGVIGAFDGCGGLGSKICSDFSNKTEAYMASRAVANAASRWFSLCSDNEFSWDTELLKEQIVSNLKFCQEKCTDQGIRLKGSLIRPFPSTIALVAFKIDEGQLISEHIWAGDSRTFVLDSSGLGQVSSDDIKGEDAMSNLTKDGALTNVLSSDSRFILHERKLQLKESCVVFAASDGCFGYVSSPMEFELMILSSLAEAENVDEWQRKLNKEIYERSGDDQTFALAAFGFDSFSDMKKHFRQRHVFIQKIVSEFYAADDERKQKLWETYKPVYYRFDEAKI